MKATSILFEARASRHKAGHSTLLDTVMPDYGITARRSAVVRAPAATVYKALARGAEAHRRGGFVLLTRQPGRELLIGTSGRAWKLAVGRAHVSGVADWCEYQGPGIARSVISLRVEPLNYQTACISAETRVQTRGLLAGLLLLAARPLLGRPVRRLLRRAAHAAEQNAGLFRLTP